MKITLSSADSDEKREFSLQVSKTLENKILVKDHPLFNIIIAPGEKKIISIPKTRIDEDTYDAQKDLVDYLFSKGLIVVGSEQGGSMFGSIEARFPNSEEVYPMKALLVAIAEFIDSEKELYDNIRQYEDDIEEWYFTPSEESSTELGEIPQGDRKGTVPEKPYGKYGGYFGYFY
tara:strand:- start:8676 stop:9200 length:525 start_codon:yes stop_codon:yes gene_type:complete